MTKKPKPKLLLNDVHIGVQRASGTTWQSGQLLRQSLLSALRKTISEHRDKDIVINGDLFDAFNVPMQDVLEFYYIVAEWMIDAWDTARWFVGRGNHDISKDSTKVSSFDFICQVLEFQYPDRFFTITEPSWLGLADEGIWMIPHMPNQDLFNLALEQVPPEAQMVLVHANFDNRFAVERDHSLNVSREQAAKIIDSGAESRINRPRRLIFGHEHQAKRDFAGFLEITGNQWPSSVTDCMGNPDGVKCYHIIHSAQEPLEPVVSWIAKDNFTAPDWRRLGELADDVAQFVRVSGTASADEAPAVIAAISRFRQRSKAFVVSNAVVVEGVKEMADVPKTTEDVRTFDVLKYLFEELEPEQAAAVKALIDKHGEADAA